MCGFAGFIDKNRITNPEQTLRKMSEQIIHRGPDDHGFFYDQSRGFYIAFRRLSIIDVSEAGHQPMQSANGRYLICFNGEIYNHKEIRAEIEKKFGKVIWNGTSDSETLLCSIELFGFNDALEKCIGMFSIALLDKKSNRLILARDRFGEKPLYYGWTRNSFVFGSEIGAISKFDGFNNPISRESVSYFMNYSYIPSPMSIYEDIYKLDAAEVIEINIQTCKTINKYKYWNLKDKIISGKNNLINDFKEAKALIKTSLRDSLDIQMRADVPLGAFLSGGIDSSLLVSLMQEKSIRKVKTFTIGFEDKNYDESPFAEEVALRLGTDHTTINVSKLEALEIATNLSNYYSEPFADSSQIPTFLVSKIARANVKVAISGDGGDELFGGYNRYMWGDRIWKKLNILPFGLRKILGKAILATPDIAFRAIEQIIKRSSSDNGVSFVSDKAKKLAKKFEFINSDQSLYLNLATEWNSLDDILINKSSNNSYPFLDHFEIPGISIQENMMFWDLDTYLKEDILTKVDRAAMANSLETRAPFLDHRLAENAFRLPLKHLISDGKGKLLLRAILEEYIPRSLIDRPKSGFGIPIGSWLRVELRDWAESLLSERIITSQGFVNYESVSKLWQNHISGREDNTVKLWNILMFTQWMDKNH